MNEEYEKGMYIRTCDGYIRKISCIFKCTDGKGESITFRFMDKYIETEFEIRKSIENLSITKSSFDMVELIEIGDIVNGYIIQYIEDKKFLCACFDNNWGEYTIKMETKDIKTITTHEKIKSEEYEAK